MAASWYVEQRERTLGPLTGSQLKELAASGRLGPDNLVRRGDHPKKVRAADVRGLFPTPMMVSSPSGAASANPGGDGGRRGRHDSGDIDILTGVEGRGSAIVGSPARHEVYGTGGRAGDGRARCGVRRLEGGWRP